MKIPKDTTPRDKHNQPMVLKLIQNIYGQKQGPKVWGDFLHVGLSKAHFQPEQI